MATLEGIQDEGTKEGEGLLHSLRSFNWGFWTRIGLAGAAAVLVAFLLGSYVVGPGRISAQEGYVPETLSQLAAASISISNPDGSVATLPVRLAEDITARNAGLVDVGPRALDTTFLLYTYTQERTATTRVPREGIRAPLELAVIDGSGRVVAVHQLSSASTSFSVTGAHQWILVTKSGLLEHFGIVEGSQLDTARINRL